MDDKRIQRLEAIADAIADTNYSELTMRVPAEPDRDADLVVSWAAREITRLRAELEAYRMAVGMLTTLAPHMEIDPCDPVSMAQQIVATVNAGLASCQQDAERYRWLRNRIPGSAYRIAGIIYSEGGAGVDAGIDAARKGEGE